MITKEKNSGVLTLFKGVYVWSGAAMALGGYIAEDLTGGTHAFEFLMLFGGLNLGMGVMLSGPNRSRRTARRATVERQVHHTSDFWLIGGW